MPIYEYRCEACGHKMDALQKLSDEPLTDCPVCEEATLRRLISAPAFRLKGGGWYETDFKTDKEKKRNLADRPEEKPKKEEKDKSASTTSGADKTSKKDAPAAKSSGSSTAIA